MEARDELLADLDGAVTALEGIDRAKALLPNRSLDAIRAIASFVRTMRERKSAVIALVGVRDASILNAWIGQPLFLSLDGEGAAIAIVPGTRTSYRAVLEGGAVEDFDAAVPDRDRELASRIEAVRSDPSIPIEVEDDEPAPIALTTVRRSWLRRLIDFVLALFGKREPPERPPPRVIVRPPPPPDDEIERVARARLAHADERAAELVRRVRELAGRSEVSELVIEREAEPDDEPITLIDLTGVSTPLERARAEADVCVVVLGDLDKKTASLARELATLASHLWIAGGPAIDDVASAVGMDPARIVRPALVPRRLEQRLLDERALGAGVRALAGLRLAINGIDEALAEEEARDAATLDRIASRTLGSSKKRRDETHKKVSGAVAGRTIRILEKVLAVLDAELKVVREERTKAALAAGSMDALKAEVIAVGPALRALRSKLASYAESLVHEAMSELAPALLADIRERVSAVLSELACVKPAPPAWPPLARVRVPEDGLVAQTTLAAGEAMRADIRWADSLLRSLAKVKARVGRELEIDLERLAQAANTEILDFEPQLGRRLQEALEHYVDAAADAYHAWLTAAVEAERSARATARAERHAGERSLREELAAHARTLADRNRALTHEMRARA